MNTKDNQRARLTRMLLKQAYMHLMHEKQPGKITVKDICELAEVNRSTFYLHYNEPNDVLTELEDETIAQVSGAMQSIGFADASVSMAKGYLIGFLQYVRSNDELFRTLLAENNDPHFRRKLMNTAYKMFASAFDLPLPDDPLNTSFTFIISGSIDVLAEWVRNEYTISAHSMADFLYLLCEGGLRNMIEKYQ